MLLSTAQLLERLTERSPGHSGPLSSLSSKTVPTWLLLPQVCREGASWNFGSSVLRMCPLQQAKKCGSAIISNYQ